MIARIFAGIGVLAFWLGVRRSVALEGLRRAFPEKSESERRTIALDVQMGL